MNAALHVSYFNRCKFHENNMAEEALDKGEILVIKTNKTGFISS